MTGRSGRTDFAERAGASCEQARRWDAGQSAREVGRAADQVVREAVHSRVPPPPHFGDFRHRIALLLRLLLLQDQSAETVGGDSGALQARKVQRALPAHGRAHAPEELALAAAWSAPAAAMHGTRGPAWAKNPRMGLFAGLWGTLVELGVSGSLGLGIQPQGLVRRKRAHGRSCASERTTGRCLAPLQPPHGCLINPGWLQGASEQQGPARPNSAARRNGDLLHRTSPPSNRAQF